MPVMYTDGSCNNLGLGGWGVVLLVKNTKTYLKGIKENTTNNRMEIQAVLEGLKKLFKYKKICIRTDSRYVIGCASLGWKRNVNTELWDIYDQLSKDKKIIFEWVKAHNGDKYNEIADRLAKGEL